MSRISIIDIGDWRDARPLIDRGLRHTSLYLASQEMIIAGTGCLAFWLCFHGSEKRGKTKLNCEEHKNASEYGGTFFKREILIIC